MIADYIDRLNRQKRKVLSVFLTAGYPLREGFTDLALEILEDGADMLEIGIPFSDPIADGPVIQQASQKALSSGVKLEDVFRYTREIRKHTDKPLILMGYANPILRFGTGQFLEESRRCGANGLIIPDVPLEEYGTFWRGLHEDTDIIQLTTPTSSEERIRAIDDCSRGFVYCVSVTGTTGVRNEFDERVMDKIRRTYRLVTRNKMLIGFGISRDADVKRFAPWCDGVIVGSAVIRLLADGPFDPALELIRELDRACWTD
jgi:tryptophan synthase alpha chain